MPTRITFFATHGEYVISQTTFDAIGFVPNVGDFAVVFNLGEPETTSRIIVVSRELHFNPDGTLNNVQLNCKLQ